jgi:hypothetical protein
MTKPIAERFLEYCVEYCGGYDRIDPQDLDSFNWICKQPDEHPEFQDWWQDFNKEDKCLI